MQTADLTLEGLVHDLNNVFQTIDEAAELLHAETKWKRVAGAIERSVERGRRIVWSLMDSSHSQTDLAPVVESSVAFAQDYLECARGGTVQFEVTVDADVRVPGSASVWERVLVNLLLNAAQAGARKVAIIARRGEICIRDDGRGISEQVLPRLFEQRQSAGAALHGIGLSIVRSFVEQNNGSVSARNLPDGGAEFLIRT